MTMSHVLGATRIAGLLVVAPLVSACCTGVTTDPRSGGLAGGVCGMSTGAYEARLDQRRGELASYDATRAKLERHLAANRTEADDLAARIGAATRRAEERVARAAATEAEIRRLATQKTASETEIAALRAEIATLDQELARDLERAKATELASRELRSGAVAAADQRALEVAAARDREKGDELDRRLSDLRRRVSRVPAAR